MDYYELCVTLNKVDLAPQVWDQEALEAQVASLGVVAIRVGLDLYWEVIKKTRCEEVLRISPYHIP